MSEPQAGAFQRYLLAKRTVDDRALNRTVLEALAAHPGLRPRPLRVLEIGCGAGTMLQRLLAWGTLAPESGVTYVGIDSDADSIALARARAAPARGIASHFMVADLRAPLAEPPFDLVIAHAVLDLLQLPDALALIQARLRPGGLAWLTLNFDGVTVLEPAPDEELEERLLAVYHRSMDERLVDGLPSGHSRTGRRIFAAARAAGFHLLAAGPSDWVVAAVGETHSAAYPADEAEFLRQIIETIVAEPAVQAAITAAELHNWRAVRMAQVQAGTLVFIAHQLDFLLQSPASAEGSLP